ncbi:MAG: M20/M25/M40 family metallo-hydrolase [Pseudomonadota bacterium]
MKRWILRVLAIVVAAAVAFGGLLVVNALMLRPGEEPEPQAITFKADIERATALLARAIQIETLSTDLTLPAFPEFLAFMDAEFPAIHSALDRVDLAARTPLYRWNGTDPTLAPILLAAHYDVVPAVDGQDGAWTHPPFAGVVADGVIWGRGALDNKGAVISILSAVETLLQDGFSPRRTIYLAFGGDEEVGGTGAQAVRDHLAAEGIQLAWVLDEGSVVGEGVLYGLERPVASVNVAEKGYLTVTLVARDRGGHSSMPPPMTAAGRIARAVDRLQRAQMPGGLDGVAGELFDALGPHYTMRERLLLGNLWIMGPIFEDVLDSGASRGAILRTTIAPTMLAASQKENVLPVEATATINFRIHPRDTIDSTLAHMEAAIDDPEIEIVVDDRTAIDPSPVSSTETQGWFDIEDALRAVFPEAIVAPGLTFGATDARFYGAVADAAYRISPVLVGADDIATIHGPDERLSIENLAASVTFYGELILKQ